ncbi:MAG: DUF1579 domain-containing protein [Propionibacteriaceae bacterium]|nr:MAG: DUF1579 domain-containing protein [Propionibacteriaceae bacterium]
MDLAERFWDLLGNWSGTEEQSASPWAPAARTRAALTFKLDLAGTAVVQDYRQVRGDGGEFLAHGVLLADEDEPDGVLWWLFDSVGHPPEPARGGWAGPVLTLTRTTPRGSARHRFELGADRLAYAIDLTLTGQETTPFLRGRYERVSGH